VIDAGYFPKQIMPRTGWLQAPSVHEICSASRCISHAPDDWVDRWLHNEFGWFNHLADALAVIPPDQRGTYRLFAYRIFPTCFRGGVQQAILVPADVHPDPIPSTFISLGFDSINKSMESVLGFECSPLSCNGMAAEIMTNAHCLFGSLEEAVSGATRFSIEQPEPGDYYVVEVLENHQAA
jgi:hypothetical protein